MTDTNRNQRHHTVGDAERLSYHPEDDGEWSSPSPRTVQQALDDIASGATWPVSDAVPIVKGSSDPTKQVRIEAGGLTTATTRAISMPDHDVDLGNDFADAGHDHNASEVTAGHLALARGGLNADASAFTASELLRINSGGTAIESAGKTLTDLVATSIATAKGDLLAATGSDAVSRLAVGGDGRVLTADSGQSTGLAWAAARANVGARVYNSADISCSSGVWTTLTFDSEKWDTDNIHSTISNTGRLTCNSAGLYVVTLGLLTEFGAAWSVASRIRYTPSGGSAVTIAAHFKKSDTHYWDMATVYRLAIGDYLTVEFYQNSGVSRAARRGGDYSVEFGIHLLATL